MRESSPRSYRRQAAVVGLVAMGAAALASQSSAQAQPSSGPFEAELTKSLGFRTGAAVTSPFVLPKPDNYLDAPARVRVISSTGTFLAPGAVCLVEYAGKRGYLRCDDASGLKAIAGPQPGTVVPPVAPPATPRPRNASNRQFCEGEAECKAFCAANCKLDVRGWAEGTMNSTCSFPADAITRAGGPLPNELARIPAMTYVKARSDAEATTEVIEALRRADAYIAGHQSTWPAGYVAYVNNCYRPPVEEATRECDFIMKSIHLENKWKGRTPTSPKEIAERDANLKLARFIGNPNDNLGLTWPGPSPHSRGQGCDIVVAKVGRSVEPTTSCKTSAGNEQQRLHSKALDEALTNDVVRGVRLNYEAWHYEFGRYELANKSCRCVAPACNEKHYPTNCKDGC
ncbi:MAG: hypothetical protein HOO96_06120 [Polyangiaceae bacterium]|nr:hypothetical protein [Polyangiaceae bacterium]